MKVSTWLRIIILFILFAFFLFYMNNQETVDASLLFVFAIGAFALMLVTGPIFSQ